MVVSVTLKKNQSFYYKSLKGVGCCFDFGGFVFTSMIKLHDMRVEIKLGERTVKGCCSVNLDVEKLKIQRNIID